jgi:hypothetical protein
LNQSIDYIYAKDTAKTLYPFDYCSEYSALEKWSIASYQDLHQEMWHPYVNWNNYSWDFDYGRGVMFTTGSTDEIKIPVKLETGNYTVMIRYLSSEQGGEFDATIGSATHEFNTIGTYNGFVWDTFRVDISQPTDGFAIKNRQGFNAISCIVVMSPDQYDTVRKESASYIGSKEVVYISDNINGSVTRNRYPEGQAIAVKKINPTEYVANLNTTSPSWMSLSETFDKNWEAEVYRNGTLIEKVSPGVAFGITNGYNINATGNLEVHFVYTLRQPIDTSNTAVAVLCIFFFLAIAVDTVRHKKRKSKG